MMTHTVRITDDADLIRSILEGNRTTMGVLMLGNLHQSGASYEGKWGQGEYLILEDSRKIVLGLATLHWNGNLVVAIWPDQLYQLITFTRTITRIEAPLSIAKLLAKQAMIRVKRSLYLDLQNSFGKPHTPPEIPDLSMLERLSQMRHDFVLESEGSSDFEKAKAYMSSLIEMKKLRILKNETGDICAMLSYNASSPKAVLIGGMFVPQQYRSKGYGKALLAAALQELQSDGEKKLVALYTDNPIAEALYKKLGFQDGGQLGVINLH